MWRGSSVDKAVRPRNELLLLIEQQKKEIERQQQIIDQQQQDLAAIQVESIRLLGEVTDLKKRKREHASNGTSSQ